MIQGVLAGESAEGGADDDETAPDEI